MEAQSDQLQDEGSYVALTHDHLNAQSIMDRVRSPQAGAIVLFAGEPTSHCFNQTSICLIPHRYDSGQLCWEACQGTAVLGV